MKKTAMLDDSAPEILDVIRIQHIDVVRFNGIFLIRRFPNGAFQKTNIIEILGEYDSFNTAILAARLHASAFNIPIDTAECNRTKRDIHPNYDTNIDTQKAYEEYKANNPDVL
jgi:hypothetical protein